MRLQDKIRGQRLAREQDDAQSGRLSHASRRGRKVEDELPVPHRSGFVQVEEIQLVFEHQKVKPKGEKAK